MKHTYAVDCHNHSACSHDGQDPVPAMLARAKEIGLYAWTLTDHCECNAFESENPRSLLSWEAMTGLKDTEGIRFLKGIELGQPMQCPEGAAEICRRPYDFIIGSLHNPAGETDFAYRPYDVLTDADIRALLDRYFEEVLDMVEQADFDSLGHLTYPLRYIIGEHERTVDMDRYAPAIDKIFETLIHRGKALEINTSGFRQKLGRPMPDGPLLARYRALGGRLVTLGSDAHTCADLGKGIDEGMEVLQAADFNEFCIFEKRQPVMLPIE